MKTHKRTVFFVSDSTGITAHTLGHSLLTQFDNLEVHYTSLPYIDTLEKARTAVEKINQAAEQATQRPLVFATLTEIQARALVATSHSMFVDLFGAFIEPLEQEFQMKSSHAIGRSHNIRDNVSSYDTRMNAINFALQHDDGASLSRYEDANVVLVGASRTGKTPTCVYLAMQYGVAAANYPLTEDDVEDLSLPKTLQAFKQKLFGLTIHPERLQQIRQERRPNSRYASLTQCQIEVQRIEALYRQTKIPYVDTTTTSVEEIATLILQRIGWNLR